MNALITSGGGAKGAFSVGVLKVLFERGYGEFDIISGTSTGALIAALAAVGRYDILENEYTNVENKDILTQDNLVKNIVEGKPYIFNTLPLERKIDQYITDEVYRQMLALNKCVCFSSVNLQTGRRTVFSTKMFDKKGNYDLVKVESGSMLRKAIISSTNQAGFLKPIEINIAGEVYQFVDGGLRDVIPVEPVLDQNPDTIFVLSNNPGSLYQVQDKYTSVLNVIMRAISIFIQDVRENDLNALNRYEGGMIYKFFPAIELDPNNPTGLNFRKSDMINWMKLGEIVARDGLKINNLIT